MPKKKRSYSAGEVFRFEIANDIYVYGQIVKTSSNDLSYFAFFKKLIKENMDLEEATLDDILIIAQTTDARLDSKDWELVGSHSVNDGITFPDYLLSTIDGWIVEDSDGMFLRKANSRDLETLKTRKSYSPASVEYAIKAYFGYVEWKDFCKNLILPKHLKNQDESP